MIRRALCAVAMIASASPVAAFGVRDEPRIVFREVLGAEMEIVAREKQDRAPQQRGNLVSMRARRCRQVEQIVSLHHTSRHLGDRFKVVPVDWNMFGVAVERDVRRRALRIRPHGDVLGVLLKSSVDYTWEANAGADLRIPVHPRVSAITEGSVRFVGVDGSRNRDTQRAGRVEGGLRFEGERGAIELVVAGERRIDAAPFDFSALGWVSAGFRFVRR